MKRMLKLFTLIIWVAVFFLPFAYAEVPHLINYQGRLTNTNGVALNGSYKITFRIYDAENAGSLLWQGTYENISITKGVFSVLLGDIDDTGYNFDKLSFNKPYWLEIKVGEDEPMKPRQRIASVGYALRAEKANILETPANRGDILYFNGTSWANLGAGITGQYLKSQGVGSDPLWSTNAPNIQVFTSSGTFIKPTGVTKVYVEVVGGGGGGGGGGQGYSPEGSDGGDSSFGSFCKATGGKGAFGPYTPGAGGTGTDGDINIPGQDGGMCYGFAVGGHTVSSDGGNSILGFGGRNGSSGKGYGGGGAGQMNGMSTIGGAGGGGGGYCAKLCTLIENVPVTVGLGGNSAGDRNGGPGVVIVRW